MSNHTRVVDQDVDAAEVLRAALRRLGDFGVVADVHRHRQGSPARGFDLFGGGVDRARQFRMRLLGLGDDRDVRAVRAARSAIAFPMPRDAPVMNSVLPVRLIAPPIGLLFQPYFEKAGFRFSKIAVKRPMRCTSVDRACPKRHKNKWRFHLSSCPKFGTRFYRNGRPTGALRSFV